MQYFTNEFIKFFKDLRKNNNRPWFLENKERYIEHVKEPFIKFIEDLIIAIHTQDEAVRIDHKQAIFRINRDIRFSKDKTPYKTYAGAVISPTGRKNKNIPGIYIALTNEKISIYGGAYHPTTQEIYAIRDAIAKDPKEFNKLLKDKNFKKHYGEFRGEKYKRIPKGYEDAAEICPEVINKQFFYGTELDPKLITDPKLFKTIMEYWKAGKHMKDFLYKAVAK